MWKGSEDNVDYESFHLYFRKSLPSTHPLVHELLGILSSLPFLQECWSCRCMSHLSGFYIGSGDLSSGPHACRARPCTHRATSLGPPALRLNGDWCFHVESTAPPHSVASPVQPWTNLMILFQSFTSSSRLEQFNFLLRRGSLHLVLSPCVNYSLFQIHYKEEYKKSKDKCTFVTDTPMLNHVKNIGAFISEVRAEKLPDGLRLSFLSL